MAGTLLDHWKAYREQAVAENAPLVQVEETRNAFYGGAAMVLMTLAEIEKPDVSEEQATQILQGMQDEVTDFIRKYAMKHGLGFAGKRDGS